MSSKESEKRVTIEELKCKLMDVITPESDIKNIMAIIKKERGN